ncbi:MAG: 6-bladed beta-propeller [Candidatus Longimicrobiales bacterium M2_2A_002]
MQLRTWTILPAALTVLAAAACGESEQRWQGTVTDSAGIEIVTSAGDGLWAPDDAWSVERDLTIGTAEGEPEYQFGQIAGIDVGPDGRIYVYDQQAREVRVFDPEGQFITAMGKAGAGPGELSQAAGPVFVTDGDTVVVPDMMQQRITLYTADGEPAGSHSLPMTAGLAVKWMEAPDQDLIQQAMVMAFPGQEDVDQKNLLLRRTPTGTLEDTILEMPIGQSVSFSGNTPNITMFESEPMWTVGPAGTLYTGINSEYSIEVHTPRGELVRIVRKPFEQRPITDSDQAEFRRTVEELWREQGMPPEALEVMSQALGFAEFYPAYANILGGPDGTLWVQRIQTPDEISEQGGTFDIQDMGSATWEVFDGQGRLLGTVEMPPRFTPLAFIQGDLYGVLRDELDVQYATRMTVDRGAPAGPD